MSRKDFDIKSVISFDEFEKIIKGIVMDAEFDAFTVYSLYFIFSSFNRLLDHDHADTVKSFCENALSQLFPLTLNGYRAIDELNARITTSWRKADFTQKHFDDIGQAFVEPEAPPQLKPRSCKKQALDLSSQPENLNILAGHIAEIMTNPATPENIFNCLSDELSDAAEGVTYSPEKIAGILESKRSRE